MVPLGSYMRGSAAAERGWARPSMDRFRAEIDEGSLYLRSSEAVATKIAWVIRLLGLSRFDLAYVTGARSTRAEAGHHRAVRTRSRE
jgi:hypothetical protein